MIERKYCNGKYTGFKHREYDWRVRVFCEKYEAFKKYVNTHLGTYPEWSDTYNEFNCCEGEVSDRAENAARNSLTWLGPTTM
jgi:hypothetical protein